MELISGGSKRGALFVVVGGVVGLLASLGIFGWIFFDLSGVGFTYGNAEEAMKFLWRAGLALWLGILNVWIISAGFWMKRDDKLKRGAVTSLILGILSLNVIAVVGGSLGFIDMKKKEPNIVLEKVGNGGEGAGGEQIKIVEMGTLEGEVE